MVISITMRLFQYYEGISFSFLPSLPCGMRSLFLRGQQEGKLIVSLRPLRPCGEYPVTNDHRMTAEGLMTIE